MENSTSPIVDDYNKVENFSQNETHTRFVMTNDVGKNVVWDGSNLS